MSFMKGLIGNGLGSIGGLMGGQNSLLSQQAGQSIITISSAGGSVWGINQGQWITSQIEYEPLYPISINHVATGRKLIIWEP